MFSLILFEINATSIAGYWFGCWCHHLYCYFSATVTTSLTISHSKELFKILMLKIWWIITVLALSREAMLITLQEI